MFFILQSSAESGALYAYILRAGVCDHVDAHRLT